MDSRSIFYGVLSVIVLIMAMNFFFVDLTDSNNLGRQDGLDMSQFNKTQEILSDLQDMKNETGGLENVPLIGDVVALLGNAVRGLQVLFSIPSTIGNMVTVAFSLGGIPAWLELVINAFIWVAIIWIFIDVATGRNK